MKTFETRTFGKWILAGEHAVLRDCPALVFPLRSRHLHFRFVPKASIAGLELKLHGSYGAELEVLFRDVLEKSFQLKKISKNDFHGLVEISSDLPIGAGLGASASLCVALTRWFQSEGLVSDSEKHEFARQLENLFHGESSGVDIAVVTEERGLTYTKGGHRNFFEPQWNPELYISFCGQKGITYECVNQVKSLIEKFPIKAAEIDQRMKIAVEKCGNALSVSKSEGFEKLKQAMDLAASCFQDWGLTQGDVSVHMNMLKSHGAASVKPTGSGGGGYILSLWDRPVPAELQKDLIHCF